MVTTFANVVLSAKVTVVPSEIVIVVVPLTPTVFRVCADVAVAVVVVESEPASTEYELPSPIDNPRAVASAESICVTNFELPPEPIENLPFVKDAVTPAEVKLETTLPIVVVEPTVIVVMEPLVLFTFIV